MLSYLHVNEQAFSTKMKMCQQRLDVLRVHQNEDKPQCSKSKGQIGAFMIHICHHLLNNLLHYIMFMHCNCVKRIIALYEIVA